MMTARQLRRARRARASEAKLLDSGEVLIPHLTAIQRMMSSAERGFHKALTALRQLQKERGFVPTASVESEPDGFVPSTSTEPAIGFVSQNRSVGSDSVVPEFESRSRTA